jgi:hypothetical protein
MFVQLDPRHGKRLIGREIRDGPLQGPRTAARTDLRAINERPHAGGPEPVLRLDDSDLAEFRVPLEFLVHQHAGRSAKELDAIVCEGKLKPGTSVGAVVNQTGRGGGQAGGLAWSIKMRNASAGTGRLKR